MRPIVFINSHPIQYFAPLYKEIANLPEIQLNIWYCSDESIQGKLDIGFGKQVQWDIPLLEGYKYILLKNYSWNPSIHAGFWGLQNWKVLRLLYTQPKSIVIIHGWAYLTHIVALIFARLFGHTVCLRAETPWNQELQKGRIKTIFKHILLRFLFLFVNRFLYIGQQNRVFYEKLGVSSKKMIFTPYAVDNSRFSGINDAVSKLEARLKLNLPENKKIILFSGKYIPKKRPLDLLLAFGRINSKDATLVFTGEGELRQEMEEFIFKNDLSDKVVLTGFVNQSLIPLYYKAADLFVMCSGPGETWGLAVNEAMNFGLPVILTEDCGCAQDLVEPGINGDIFKTGDIPALAGLIDKYLQLPGDKMEEIKQASISRIDRYSYQNIILGLKKIA